MEMSVQELEELKAHLMASDEEFRELANEHAILKKRVAEIEADPHPSDDDVLEEARLKRRKLYLKDRMMDIMHHHREAQLV
jgi:uncharacterized protein YdcH (DUF465 family)